MVEVTGKPVQYTCTGHNFALCFSCFAKESTAKENSLHLIQFQEVKVVELVSSGFLIVYNSVLCFFKDMLVRLENIDVRNIPDGDKGKLSVVFSNPA